MPNTEQDRLETIYALIRNQKHEQARSMLGALLKANPNSADGLYLATFLVSSDEQKIKLCERVLNIDPEHRSARMLLNELRPPPPESEAQDFDLDSFVDDLPPAEPRTPFMDDLPVTPVKGAARGGASSGNLEKMLIGAVALLIVAILVVIFAIRQSANQNAPTAVLLVVSLTPRPTDTASPTYTPSATFTRRPTITPLPSNTPYRWWLTLTAVAAGTRAPNTTAVFVSPPTNTPSLPPTRSINLPPTWTPYVPPPTATPSYMAVDLLPGDASMLDFRVVDAEYSTSLDRLVMISSDPPTLHILDPETSADQAISLNRAALCVGISPDGKWAAVGHDAQVTIIDLSAAAVFKMVSISTTASDIVITNDSWVYVMPRVDQWTDLHVVNVATEQETIPERRSLIRASGVIKLHPDGNRMYYLDRGISPAHMHRYDISDRVNPYETRDWPYHGDYYPCGAMWISASGERIFGGCGNAFRLSTDDNLELTYNGSLEKTTLLSALAHAQAAELVLGIVSLTDIEAKTTADFGSYYYDSPSPTNLLAVYNYDALTRVSVFRLPRLPADTRGQNSFGYFLFTNAAGTRFYVIAQADKESGLVNDFGIIKGDVSEVSS